MIPEGEDDRLFYARTLLAEMGIAADAMGDDEVRACMRPTVVAVGPIRRRDVVAVVGPGKIKGCGEHDPDWVHGVGQAERDILAGERVAYCVPPHLSALNSFGVTFVVDPRPESSWLDDQAWFDAADWVAGRMRSQGDR